LIAPVDPVQLPAAKVHAPVPPLTCPLPRASLPSQNWMASPSRTAIRLTWPGIAVCTTVEAKRAGKGPSTTPLSVSAPPYSISR